MRAQYHLQMSRTKNHDLAPLRKIMITQEGSIYAWAKKHGWSQNFLWRWEIGHHKPSIDTMKRLARDLYGDEKNWPAIAQYF